MCLPPLLCVSPSLMCLPLSYVSPPLLCGLRAQIRCRMDSVRERDVVCGSDREIIVCVWARENVCVSLCLSLICWLTTHIRWRMNAVWEKVFFFSRVVPSLCILLTNALLCGYTASVGVSFGQVVLFFLFSRGLRILIVATLLSNVLLRGYTASVGVSFG